MASVKRKVYEVCFTGCTPYTSLVDGYYSHNDVIYDGNNRRIEEEEILMRDLFTEEVLK